MKKSYITTGALALTGALVFGGAGVALADGAADEAKHADAWEQAASQALKADAESKMNAGEKQAHEVAKADDEALRAANSDGGKSIAESEKAYEKDLNDALKNMGVDAGSNQAYVNASSNAENKLKDQIEKLQQTLDNAKKNGVEGYEIMALEQEIADKTNALKDLAAATEKEKYFLWTGIDTNTGKKLLEQAEGLTPEEKAEIEKELEAASSDEERAEIINKLIEEGKITADGAKATVLPKTGDAATAGAFAGFAALMAGALVAARKKVLG